MIGDGKAWILSGPREVVVRDKIPAEVLDMLIELRQQRASIQSIEVQLVAAKKTAQSTIPKYIESIYQGSTDEGSIRMVSPIGDRRKLAQVRNLVLRLARAKAVLEELELAVRIQH